MPRSNFGDALRKMSGAGSEEGAQAAPEEAPAQIPLHAYYALALLCVINALNFLDRSALALVLPQLKRELQLSDTVLGLISGLPFAVCYALCAIPAAWIADNWSRRRLITLGLAFWSACTMASAAVTSGVQLAAARFLLGAGESTGLPASASMIADLFTLRQRAIGFAALAASPYLGVLVGFPMIGWVTDQYGWRAAFVAAGAPGLVLALLFYLTVREPLRRTTRGASADAASPPLRETFVYLMRTPSYPWVVIGGALSAANFGSMFSWGPTYMTRVLDLGPQEIGHYFGAMRGLAGLAGALVAGALVAMLIKKHPLWQVWAPMLMALILFPSDAVFLFSTDPLVWQAALAFSAFLVAAIVATGYLLYVNIAPARMRATATALYLLVASLTGLTAGPLIVGVLNDLLVAQYGDAAIRYSMLAASFSSVLYALVLLLAARTWRRDMERALDR
ncbi:MAG: MFS transporter [Hyphomonadaceae bacterium]|nr:MFS transporter [Hyphomonadaceae bacterium]